MTILRQVEGKHTKEALMRSGHLQRPARVGKGKLRWAIAVHHVKIQDGQRRRNGRQRAASGRGQPQRAAAGSEVLGRAGRHPGSDTSATQNMRRGRSAQPDGDSSRLQGLYQAYLVFH